MVFDDFTLMRRDTLTNERPGSTRIVYGANTLPFKEVWCINKTGGALTAGRPYLMRNSGDETTNFNVIAPVPSNTSGFAALSGIVTPDLVVVAGAATANNAYGWMCYMGWRTVFVEGTVDVADGDPLCLTTSTTTTALRKRTDTAAEGIFDVAYAAAAQAANSEVLTLCFLTGLRVNVR